MSRTATAILFALAMLTSPLALAQGNFANGQILWTNNNCADCHEFLGAAGLQAVRDRIAQRLPTGLTYQKSFNALTTALTGTSIDQLPTGMDGFVFSATEVADLAMFIANMLNPAPMLSHTPFPGPIFPPTAVAAMASQTVTVTNTGTAVLVFATNGAAQVASGPNVADFSVTGAQCQGMTLQPNVGSCTVTVQFRPTAGTDVARNASLALVTMTSPNPTLVPLFGTVLSAPPASTPPGTTPAPAGAANAPSSGGGALPWQALGVLFLALIAGGRRRTR